MVSEVQVVSTSSTGQEYAKKIHLVMDDEDDFREFTDIVRSFKSKEILESTAIIKLTRMIKHKFEDLTLGLNHCLSDGFKIEKSGDGQLFYRSPAQEDLVPLLVDERMQQIISELSEAKLKLLREQEEHQSAVNTIRRQSVTIDELQCALEDEKEKSRDDRRRLEQESKLALEHEQQKNEAEIQRFHQETLRIQEEETQRVKDDFDKFREKTNNREEQMKQYIRKLQADKKASENLKGRIKNLEAQQQQEQRKYKDEIRTIQEKSKLTKDTELQKVKAEFEKFREQFNTRKKQLKERIRQLQAGNRENRNLKGIIKDLEFQNQMLRGQADKHDRMKQVPNMHIRTSERQVSEIRKKVQSFIPSTECPICLEPMKDTHVSPDCLHRFYGDCFKTSIRKCNNECPMCRTHLGSKRCLRKDEDHDSFVRAFYEIRNIVFEADGESDDDISNEKAIEYPKPDAEFDGCDKPADDSLMLGGDGDISDSEGGPTEEVKCPDRAEVEGSHQNKDDRDDRKKEAIATSEVALGSKALSRSFIERLQQLKVHKVVHGHLDVTAATDLSLAHWCEKVRQSFRMADERIKLLSDIGFNFDSNQSSSRRSEHVIFSNEILGNKDTNDGKSKAGRRGNAYFNTMLQQLKTFKAEHGHMRVEDKDDRMLVKWCSKVRRAYRYKGLGQHTEIILTKERIRSLQRIGFDFGPNISSSQKTAVDIPNGNSERTDEWHPTTVDGARTGMYEPKRKKRRVDLRHRVHPNGPPHQHQRMPLHEQFAHDPYYSVNANTTVPCRGPSDRYHQPAPRPTAQYPNPPVNRPTFVPPPPGVTGPGPLRPHVAPQPPPCPTAQYPTNGSAFGPPPPGLTGPLMPRTCPPHQPAPNPMAQYPTNRPAFRPPPPPGATGHSIQRTSPPHQPAPAPSPTAQYPINRPAFGPLPPGTDRPSMPCTAHPPQPQTSPPLVNMIHHPRPPSEQHPTPPVNRPAFGPTPPGEAGTSIPRSAPPPLLDWTKADDARLSDILKKFKRLETKDWEAIAKEFGQGRTAKQCNERWIRYLKPGGRKGQWQDHEDAIVIDAVTTCKEQPFTRWSDLAQKLPGRVSKQIRDRWVNHLNPNINHMPFTKEDDMKLWEGHKQLGKRWVEISTKFFKSSRSENHIKNRWYSVSFKKFVTSEFGKDAYPQCDKKSKSGKPDN